jgi:thioredoxin 1
MELYYFWKDHCAPCKAAKPVVEQVAKELDIPVKWLDVRSPEGEPYIIPFNLLAVPTLVLVKDKRKVLDITGPDLQNAAKLTKRLDKQFT